MSEMTLPSPRLRQGQPNQRPLPSPQLPCQLEAAQSAGGLQDILRGGKPNNPIPAEGTPRPHFPPTPSGRGRGFSKPTALPSNPRALSPAPCRRNQSLPGSAHPASLLLSNRAAPLAFSRLRGEGGGYVLSVFPKRGGASVPARCPRTACAIGVAAAVGVARAEAAVSGSGGRRARSGLEERAGPGRHRAGTALQVSGVRWESG